MELTKGANATLPNGLVKIRVTTVSADVDVTAYVLGQSGKVSHDEDMVFYNQPSSADGALRLSIEDSEATTFSFDPSRASASVARVAFAAVVSEPASRISPSLAVSVEVEGSRFTFSAGAAGGTERALVLVELYRRDATWKVRAVAQGFDGGLKPLSEYFGVVVDADIAPTREPASPPSPVTPPRMVSLSKVTLDKERPRIDLSKGTGEFGEISINLNWNRSSVPSRPNRGLFSRPTQSKGIDLDLGCLYEMRDGTKGCVQALGDSFGSYSHSPFVVLSGDDRTGAVADGEWLRVNGAHWGDFKRILVYTFIYEGVPDWSATDAVVTLCAPGQPPIEVRVDGDGGRHTMCAIALLENTADGIRVNRAVRYFSGHSDMDRAYGWGMRWVAGSKN